MKQNLMSNVQAPVLIFNVIKLIKVGEITLRNGKLFSFITILAGKIINV